MEPVFGRAGLRFKACANFRGHFYHESKGTIKEAVGKIIDDPNLEAEGLAEKVAGKVQKKIGQVEKVLEK
jgi:uncharacterized protein YjbJ (UPF0337 family)